MPRLLFAFQTLSVFFLGMAAGFSIVLLLRKIFKKSKNSSYPVLLILSLAVMILSVTTVFLIEGNPSLCAADFIEEKTYFLVLFFASVAFAAFVKFLLVPFLIFYGAFFFYTKAVLKENCVPVTQQLTIRAENSSEIDLKILSLPKKLPLPLPEKYVLSKDSENSYGESESFLKKYENWLLSDTKTVKIPLPEEVMYPSVFIIEIKNAGENFDYVLNRSL